MKTILSYPLTKDPVIEIMMPQYADILRVESKPNYLEVFDPMMFVCVETTHPSGTRVIYVVGTGMECKEEADYIGSLTHAGVTYHYLDGGYE